MLKCAILKEISYQDSISGIKKIAYEKNKGRNRQMEDADVSQKVLKQLYKTEFNKLTPEDIESVKRVIYKYMNQSGASGYEVKMLVNPELSEEKSQFVNNVISNYMDKYNMYVHDDGITYSKKAQGRYDDASAGAKFYFALYKYREYFSIFEH